MKRKESGLRIGWFDGRFTDFDRRLREILGEGRIPRRDKEAKAEQAMQAVDDLVEGITGDLGLIDKSK